MKRSHILIGVSAIALTFASCKREGCMDNIATNYDAKAKTDDGSCQYEEGYTVPTTYNFTNVSYTGQTVRLLLLADLETKIEEAISGLITEQELLDIYENTNQLYTDIATDKNLSGKTEVAADTQVRLWFAEIAALSSSVGGYTNADNVDLKQMVGKTLMGAIFYNQAADNYLANLETDNNSIVTDGKGTDMEHHFDEGFGYFGAMRDYNSHTDAENKTPGEFDADGSGGIDPTSEKNFYFSLTAVKRDLGSVALGGTDATNYSKDIFDGWLSARAAISNQDYTVRDEQVSIILNTWEKTIAATVIHYVNDFSSNVINGDAQVDINKHWAELLGYANMLQYNASAVITSTSFETVISAINTSPDYFTNDVNNLTDLEVVLNELKSTYGFSDAQVAAW